MDTILIDAAYILAGDSKFRLSCRQDRGQSPTLSFTYNHASHLVFLHIDGDFSYGHTGFYPESNSIELYFDLHSAWQLWGVLKNIVERVSDPGEQPEIPIWKHTLDSEMPVIIEEYTIQAKGITIMNPLNLSFKPRTAEGFTTYVALTRAGITHDDFDPISFRLKFWLTEKAIPELDLLQRYYKHDNVRRTQPVYTTVTFDAEQLSLLRCQLDVLKNRYILETEYASLNS